MFGDVLAVFVVELSQHAFADEYDVVADLSFLQQKLAFFHLFANQDFFDLSSAFGSHARITGIDSDINCLFE